jgi:serine phosphatase RsbU (regulator of sigma subunit)
MLFAGNSSSRARLLWSLVLALSPLAYALAIMLMFAYDPNTNLSMELDRKGAVERARAYGLSIGVETDGWSAGHRYEAKNNHYFYYRLNPGEMSEKLRRIAPEIASQVIFVSPDGAEKFRVGLSHDGAPISFSRSIPDSVVFQDQGALASRQVADRNFARLRETFGLNAVSEPEMEENRESNGSIERKYSYRLDTQNLPGIKASYRVTIGGGDVVGVETDFDIDEKYSDANFLNKNNLSDVFQIMNGILIGIILIYGFYRYFRLTQQKEVPHSRTLMLCVLGGAVFVLFAYQSEFFLFELPTSSAVLYWTILGASFVGYMLLGLLSGIAYSSGEGDAREHYPEKLISIDALLAGRIFSRNVAYSVLAGAALGGWMLLVERLAILPYVLRADSGQGLSEKSWSVFGGSITSIISLISPPFSGVYATVLALLLPLAFLNHRRIRSRKVFFALLAVVSLIVNLQVSYDRPLPPLAALLIAASITGTLLLAFFFFDLMTAIVAVAASSLVHWVVYMTAQPSGSLRHAGIIAVVSALVILIVAGYFLVRGRLYAEADVRPLYARFLAERVQMQAEESAAREAQVRLMPQSLPKVAGVEIAAACHPAHTVGGDFYDLFPLTDDRLGLFIAEGGGGGLGSALTIAFAKGFLMPRIESGIAPGDILCSLQTQLAPLLESNEELTVAFAVIDSRRQTISYARTGEYPRVYLARSDSERSLPNAASETVKEVSRSWSATSVVDEKCAIREATLQANAGDTVLFFTDGIGKSLNVELSSPDKFTRMVSGQSANKKVGVSLQHKLDATIERQARRARRINLDDDLTAIVISFEQADTHA